MVEKNKFGFWVEQTKMWNSHSNAVIQSRGFDTFEKAREALLKKR